jgi:prolyl-tRNA synthetase
VVVAVNWADEQTRKVAEDLYAKLNAEGIETLLDDRDERAGIKFKDADLIGIPYRITVGERNLKENKVEFKARAQKNAEARLVPIESILAEVKNLLKLN